MILEIPDKIANQLSLNQQELMLEFSIFLYQREVISMRAAAELAGISWVTMEQELAQRRISMHYSEKELEEDSTNLELAYKEMSKDEERENEANE